MDRKLGHCREKYLLGESGKTQISRYRGTGKTKSMQVLLGRGLTTKAVNVLAAACIKEVFGYGEFGRWGGEGKLQAPGKLPWY